MRFIVIIASILPRSILLLTIFVISISLLLSGIVTFMSIIFFPNEEITELEKQNHSLANHIVYLEKEIPLLNEKIKVLNQYRTIKIAVQKSEEDSSVKKNLEKPSLAAIFIE